MPPAERQKDNGLGTAPCNNPGCPSTVEIRKDKHGQFYYFCPGLRHLEGCGCRHYYGNVLDPKNIPGFVPYGSEPSVEPEPVIEAAQEPEPDPILIEVQKPRSSEVPDFGHKPIDAVEVPPPVKAEPVAPEPVEQPVEEDRRGYFDFLP